jgi:hypothetical protein
MEPDPAGPDWTAVAQLAVKQLESSVHGLLARNSNGLSTGEVARRLGIESHCPSRNSNWLARSVLEGLVTQGRAVSGKQGRARQFRAL